MAEGQSQGRCWIGFDLGGTKMMAALLDADFHILVAERKKTKGNEGTEALLARACRLIQEVMGKGGEAVSSIAGIGLGCAGPLDLERGVVLEAPNLGWKELPLQETLQRVFQCPVVLSNDADAGTYGEYRFGAGQEARCLVGVFLGTGIGGGCVHEGRLLRGQRSSVMEIGHLVVMPGGPLCGCGKTGCLEAVAGRLAIASEAAVSAFRGSAPNLLRCCGTSLADIRSGDLANAINAGDETVAQIVRKAGRSVGLALANVVNLLAPDLLLLGGGLMEALAEILFPIIEAEIRARAMKGFTQDLRVERAVLGDQAIVLGAAALAAERVGPS